ncbi:hypothetical protein BLNAU_17934 [Blattamonas nauphoetae]|uniref:Uncharacterized protein n=1 Tax=Blattamonas nauphoetae TaxID=2049346 RepID=A0ABQ9X6D0_9EUKA|nr:hypothetical protein BLNAU_17934 [Blattamonas nauphoetae]
MCRCFVDSDHPHGTSSIFLKLLDIVFFLLGAFILLVSILFSFGNSFNGFTLVLIIVSIALIVVPIIGNIGSGYGSAEKKSRLVWLIIYYIIILLTFVFMFAICLICFLIPVKANTFRLGIWHYVSDFVANAKPWLAWLGTLLGFCNSNTVIGVICVVVAAVLLLCFFFTCRIMTLENFVHATNIFVNFAEMAVAVVLIVIFFLSYKEDTIIKDIHWIYLVFIGVAGFVVLMDIYGVVCACLRRKTTCPMCFFSVVIIIVLVALLAVLIVTFVMNKNLSVVTDPAVDKECKGNPTSCLTKYLEAAYNTTCDRSSNRMYECPSTFPKVTDGNDTYCDCTGFNDIDNIDPNLHYEYVKHFAYRFLKNELKLIGVLCACASFGLFLLVISSCLHFTYFKLTYDTDGNIVQRRTVNPEYIDDDYELVDPDEEDDDYY